MQAREFFRWQARGELPALAAHGVVAEAAGECALGAQDFAVQVVALDVADQLTVEVELVQVAAALVQMVEVLAGGQRQGGEVAQWIVVVGQGALRRGLLDQAAEQVVGKLERFFADADLLALRGWQTLDRQQPITIVIHVILTGVGIELGQQPANAVALEFGTTLWSFAAFAVAGFVDLGQMPAEVVAEASGQVVDAFFFDQPVGRIVGKLVRRVVFVDQCSQANRRVVFVADALALGVLAAARQATGGAQQACGLAFAVGVRQYLAEGVVGEGLGAAVRMIDAQHFAVRLAFQGSGLAQRVGDGDQVLALVEAVGGVFTRTILEAFDLGQGVPLQAFGHAAGVDY